MSEFLKKDKTIFPRGENGELLPIEIVLELMPGKDKPKAMILPMTKGAFQKLKSESVNGETTRDQDAEVISKYCVNPEYTLEEAKNMFHMPSAAIVMAIISASTGVSQEKIKEKGKLKALNEAEALLKEKKGGMENVM